LTKWLASSKGQGGGKKLGRRRRGRKGPNRRSVRYEVQKMFQGQATKAKKEKNRDCSLRRIVEREYASRGRSGVAQEK